MSANRVTALIAAVALIAIAVVVVTGVSEDEKPKAASKAPEEQAPAPTPAPNSDAHMEAHANDEPAAPAELAPTEVPADPDAVRGTDSFALTRPANLRRALAVLDRRRARVRGVFDGLRIAPGRIDTEIVHPYDRRTNIQIRPDLEISFESTHDFPTPAGFRKQGLTARDLDVRAPARLLRGIDRRRAGSAAYDLDYIVIDRDNIDRTVDVNAYMRVRTSRPRYFRLERGRIEAIG